jgi:hypothetical protein
MYHATECIFDLIAASGPQADVRRECREQCVPFADPLTITLALAALLSAGIIEFDDGYELTDFGQELVKMMPRRAAIAEANRKSGVLSGFCDVYGADRP